MRTPSRRRRRRTPARAKTVTASRPGPTAALYLRGFRRDLADALHLAAVTRKTTIGELVTAAGPAILATLRTRYTAPPLVPLHLRDIPRDLADALRIAATRRKVRIADLLAAPLRAWLDARPPRRRRR